MRRNSDKKNGLFVRIRREKFGYILFERFTRAHYFVETKEILEGYSEGQLKRFLETYFGSSSEIRYEFISFLDSCLELSAPVGMYMEITERCNLSCKHCYKPSSKHEAELGLENTKKLISELRDMGVFEIRLCGNEPTASPYFFDVCKYIKDLDLFLGVNTNAFFGEEMQERIIDLAPDFIVVSVDGTKKTHDAIRTIGSYEKSVSFLRRLSQTPIKRRINTLVSKVTIDSIEHIAQLAKETGSGVSFLPLRTIGRETHFKEDEAINASDMLLAVRKITGLRKDYPGLSLLTYFDLFADNPSYHHSMDFNKPCPSRKNGFITYSGDFFPCDFLRYLGDKYHCGNVLNDGFYRLWHDSSELKNFQCIEHKKCSNCKFYMTKCYGGCISGSIASTNRPDDELCFAHLL